MFIDIRNTLIVFCFTYNKIKLKIKRNEKIKKIHERKKVCR